MLHLLDWVISFLPIQCTLSKSLVHTSLARPFRGRFFKPTIPIFPTRQTYMTKKPGSYMTPLIKILAGAIPALVLVFSLALFLWWRKYQRRHQQQQQQQQRVTSANSVAAVPSPSEEDVIQAAIDKFHSKSGLHQLHLHQKQKPQQQFPPYEWSQFVFVDRSSSVPQSSSSSSSPLWSLCATGDAVSSQESPQIKWEVKPGASEAMQSVRIRRRRNSSSPLHAIRMSLPLPGGSSFPQEAYFEITIMRLNHASGSKKLLKDGAAGDDGGDDDDRMKLIEQKSRKVHSEGETQTKIPPTTEHEHKPARPLVCLGLTGGGYAESKLIPGSYPGSIGFQSNGSVCLDGIKLVSESNRTEWATGDRVVGCGFSPSKKTVFFTVDSELVHVVRCHSEAYKSPLYPVLAANCEVTVLVNLGQAAFEYVPANAPRHLLPSPPSYSCGRSVGAYEDSREFFSIGMPDTECFDRAASTKSPGIANSIKKSSKSRHKYWDDADSGIADVDKDFDLFEIALNYQTLCCQYWSPCSP